jgi:nudix-type nucleoside diphosphatase (YffH/AdpP family)
MPRPSRVDIAGQQRLLDAFFKIDEYRVSYERYDGTMSPYCERLNFERGDAVGVLLFNTDRHSVVLVEQFKLPTLIGRRRDNPSTQDGWITEVMAGMIGRNEDAEGAAIRETLEETGYEIDEPELICRFLSSPGGTSERIFLYFSKVADSRRPGKDKIGVGDENIRVVEISVNDLFVKLEKGQIDDPKLALAAYWLKDNMARIESLDPDTVRYELVKKPGFVVGYKTGDIRYVKGVDVWVNGESSDMMMDRFVGQTISARIRSMGAAKKGDVIVDDVIQESLRGLMGDRANVDIGTVLVTEPGMLRQINDVQRVFHVAVVKGGLGEGIKAELKNILPCAEAVLAHIEQENKRLWRQLMKANLDSVLFPMLGAGEGGLPIQAVADEIIPAATNYFKSTPYPTIREIYFLAFTLRERNACEKILNGYCEQGVLRRIS